MPQNPHIHRAHDVLRKLVHLLMLVLGWVGFVWMWVLVAARPWDSQRLLWLIVGSLIVVPLLTAAWVMHNRSIHRRKGERHTVSRADTSYVHDWHGRVVRADWAALRRSRLVLVGVEGNIKRYVDGLAGVPGETEVSDAQPQLTPLAGPGRQAAATQRAPQD